MVESNLHELIYTSVAVSEMNENSLEAILNTARQFNSQNQISGLLIYHQKTREFIQLLEGDRRVITDLFSNRICMDSRHMSIERFYEGPSAGRLFSEWSMAFYALDGSKPVNIEGYSDFFSSGFSHATIDQARGSRAKRFMVNVADVMRKSYQVASDNESECMV